ncbi:uncharacterized protein MELLADRAFT_60613 [Melampsora larici-populina 98AG31]|uniref:Uncharacterized protein n=1 Tax=Melampsora larici-populina (strain 98AG31 / pathotype 3-4-7) TaxID=747676 RepID=F4RBP9_MELLP|nr:uncharacterized protein MELLADRAFT_60613 [Melampsora larici-populina 98AG31]EGG10299.1 hypothetical protein MELLADRAFT_60613 [Melampsora larici-populina 98AG31]
MSATSTITSTTRESTVVHPIVVQFIGRLGTEVPNARRNALGFVSHETTISTSGFDRTSPYNTAILLTAPKGAIDKLHQGDVYAISCKLISSNNRRLDDLYCGTTTILRIGKNDSIGVEYEKDVMNKVSMVALGIVVKMETVPKGDGKRGGKIVLTLTSVDFDPIDQSPVCWMTKHIVERCHQSDKFHSFCKEGAEVQIAGLIEGYDDKEWAWETRLQVYNITPCNDSTPNPNVTEKGKSGDACDSSVAKVACQKEDKMAAGINTSHKRKATKSRILAARWNKRVKVNAAHRAMRRDHGID